MFDLIILILMIYFRQI